MAVCNFGGYMKKTYVVSTGSCSHYKVIGLFSTRKRAQEFMAAVPDLEYNAIEKIAPTISDGRADFIPGESFTICV